MLRLSDKRVWVAGHRGMVGSALIRALEGHDVGTILTADRTTLDLTRQADVEAWMTENRPDVILLAAAKVGGILANDSEPADFLYDNLMISANIIHAAAAQNVDKLLYLGSSCVYPKLAQQPIREDSLLTGPLEPTNQWYAVAKIAGIKLCQAYRRQHGHNFIAAMPTNLYGPNDNYDLQTSHVLPALLRKTHEAKLSGADHITLWGTGTPRREFMHVDDMARGCLHLLDHYSDPAPINLGYGEDVTIAELAQTIAEVVGFGGELRYDSSKPDGTPRKLMDSARLRALGWSPTLSLRDGIARTYSDYLATLR